MTSPVRITQVHHLCGSSPLGEDVSLCEEIEKMEKKVPSKLKDGTPVELHITYVKCVACEEMFSFTYYVVD